MQPGLSFGTSAHVLLSSNLYCRALVTFYLFKVDLDRRDKQDLIARLEQLEKNLEMRNKVR